MNERTGKKRRRIRSTATSKTVGLGKVNGGNKDHGTEMGMARDGDALLAPSSGGKSETEQPLEGGSRDGRSEE